MRVLIFRIILDALPVVCFPKRHHLTVRLERIHGHIESGGLEAVAVAGAAVVVTQLAIAVGAVVLQVPQAFAKLGRSAANGAEGDGREKRRTLKHQEAEIGAGTADSVKFRQSLVTANAAVDTTDGSFWALNFDLVDWLE